MSTTDSTDISRTASALLTYRVGCDNGLMLSSQWVCSIVTVFPVLYDVTGMPRICLVLPDFVICNCTIFVSRQMCNILWVFQMYRCGTFFCLDLQANMQHNVLEYPNVQVCDIFRCGFWFAYGSRSLPSIGYFTNTRYM